MMVSFDPNYSQQIPEPPANPVQTARKQIALLFLTLLFILTVSSVVATVLTLVLRARMPEILTRPGALILLSSLPSYALAMPLSLLLFRKIPKAPPEKKKIAILSLVGFLCLALILTFLGGILGNLINALFGSITGEMPTNALDSVATVTPLWMQFLFFVILAPIFEELFYRKFLYDRLCAFGELPAILVCGITFGLIHENFYQFFYAAAVGILFTFIYAKTGNIFYTMGLHALLNFSGTILTEWLNLLPEHLGLRALILIGALALLGLVCAVLYWILRRKRLSFSPGSIPLDLRQWALALFLNPGTCIFLFVILLSFFSELILPLLTKL